MSPNNLIIIAAGISSGVLQAATAFPTIGGLLLAYIAPLPIFLVGLGIGGRGAAVSTIIAAAFSLIFTGPIFVVTQVLIYGLPIIILCRQAILSRSGSGGQLYWYPIGNLILCMAGLAFFGFIILMIGLALFGDGFMAYLGSVIEPVASAFPAPENKELMLSILDYVPAFFVMSWMLSLIFNATLAQGLLVRFCKNIRPTPLLSDIRLPGFWIGVLLVGFGLAFQNDLLGVFGKTLTAIAIVPYFLLGLGVIHSISRPWKARTTILVLFYALLLLWPSPVFVAVLGLLNAVMGLFGIKYFKRSGKDVKNLGNMDKEE